MSEFKGYAGRSLEFLRSENLAVGDRVRIAAGLTYSGVLMPRYEGGSGGIIVLKLPSGYNVGVDVDGITGVERLDQEPEAEQGADAPAGNPALPKILLLSTGGTIASRIDYRTGAVTPTVTPEDLNASVPELGKIANIETEILFSEYSENLQPEHWQGIAQRLDQLSGSDYRGIIVAHGTDTMHYTSAFLSFALTGYPIPIAMVGSQRSSDRPSSDAALNLIGAARFLTECGTRGVFVVMHHGESDTAVACHLGTRVRKMHTSRRGAFQTINSDPAFLITDGEIKRNMDGGFFGSAGYNPRTAVDARVALVKYHPGYDPAHLDYLVESGTRAVIFEGTGLGHVGRTLYGAVERAARKGVFLGMASQCVGGRTRMTVYESGRDLTALGVTPLGDMLSEVALVKAMWALGNSQDRDGFLRLMLSRVASESSD
jgi:glutamyl-tRNA(Gln) amidotransferase subunit D